MKEMAMIRRFVIVALVVGACFVARARAEEAGPLEAKVREGAGAVQEKVVQWRRDIHQHPELGDQETRTSGIVADHLRNLGLEVRTGMGGTGVVGILKGARPGRTVALRADMDALPVQEPDGLPFASKAKQQYMGKEVPVMHACGHDAHTAMLMGAAEVLSRVKGELPGTVLFVFQPAEEGSSVVTPASGKSWGAKRMLEDGAFKDPKPDVVFGLHVMPGPLGQISYRTGATTASSDDLGIVVTGKQGHGGMPWNTIDPITTSAQTILGLQTVVSRKADLTASPVVVTVGTINGGSRGNVVPETVSMAGTIRTYDENVREQVVSGVRLTAEKVAEGAGATADVRITRMYPPTMNDEGVASRMLPVLKRAADGQVAEAPPSGATEDFSLFAQAAPGLYVFLGVTPRDQDPARAAPNHNPKFFVDEAALVVGTRTMAMLSLNFLNSSKPDESTPKVARPFIQEEK
jgi:amidohydrolase